MIMQETWNLVHKYRNMNSFRKYALQEHAPLNFVEVNIFLVNSLRFYAEILPLFETTNVKSFLVPFSVTVK